METSTEEYNWWMLDVIANAAANTPVIGPWLPAMPESWVYFIQCGDGPIKIGYTNKVAHRFSMLQSGSPVEHHCLGQIPGGRKLERDLHTMFRHDHVRGEWFTPSAELLAYIEGARFTRQTKWRGSEHSPAVGRPKRQPWQDRLAEALAA